MCIRDRLGSSLLSYLNISYPAFTIGGGIILLITAILYSLFVALNIGIEFFGFCLLLISAILIGIWAYRGGNKGILLLQFFYATAGIIGMVRWF